MSTRRKFECIKDLVCKLAMLDLPEEVQALRKKVETEFADYINGDTISLPWNIEDVHETAKEMATGLVEDPDELAILSQQQEQRMAESAVARMLDSGALVLEGKRIRRASGSPRGALEARIAQIGEAPHWRQILRAAKEEGMRFLRESALEKALQGTTTLREINRFTFVD